MSQDVSEKSMNFGSYANVLCKQHYVNHRNQRSEEVVWLLRKTEMW